MIDIAEARARRDAALGRKLPKNPPKGSSDALVGLAAAFCPLPGHSLQEDQARVTAEGRLAPLQALPDHFQGEHSRNYHREHKWCWDPRLLHHAHRYLSALHWFPIHGGVSWLEVSVDFEACVPGADREDIPVTMHTKAMRVKAILEKTAALCGTTVVPGVVNPGRCARLQPYGIRPLAGILGWRPAFRHPAAVHSCLDHVATTGDASLKGSWPPASDVQDPVAPVVQEDPHAAASRAAQARNLAAGDHTLFRQELRRLEYNAGPGPDRHTLGPWCPLNPDQRAGHRVLTCTTCARQMIANQLGKQLSYPCPGPAGGPSEPLHKIRVCAARVGR